MRGSSRNGSIVNARPQHLELHLEPSGQLDRLGFVHGSDIITLEQHLNALVRNTDVPGLSLALIRSHEIVYTVSLGLIFATRYPLALIRSHEIVYTGGFGVADKLLGTPVLPNTIFEAASISKPVVAYAILQLCDHGLLELDDLITSFLDQSFDGQLHGVTLRHALSHTSGLPNWLAEGAAPRTYFAPGSRFSYSGVGYRLLQRVIENLTGYALEEYIAQHVWRPLLMHDSSFIWRPDFGLRCATAHDSHGQPAQKSQSLEAHGASSLHSTAADLARFLIATMQPDSLGEQMFEAQVAVNDSAPWHCDWPRADVQLFPNVFWGLGWGLEVTPQGRCCWQWGDNPGFKAFALASLETGDGFVALSNSANGDRLWSDLAREFLPGQHPSLRWLEEINSHA